MAAVIKRPFLVNGFLAKAINRNDQDIVVDQDTANKLDTVLNIGDWCYLSIKSQDSVEVIRIEKGVVGLQVYRAQDGTVATDFPFGTPIKYELTRAEVVDLQPLNSLSITSDGLSGLLVEQNNGYNIQYKLSNVATLGGIEVTVEQDGEIVVRDRNGAFGCCDSNLTGAPSAGGVQFYLTSQLYAYEYYETDCIQMGKNTRGEDFPPLSDKSWWLLDQPYSTEKYITTTVSNIALVLYGGSKTVNITENYINTGATLFDISRYGGAKQATIIESFIVPTSYLLDMQQFGNNVVYSGSEKYITTGTHLFDIVMN